MAYKSTRIFRIMAFIAVAIFPTACSGGGSSAAPFIPASSGTSAGNPVGTSGTPGTGNSNGGGGSDGTSATNGTSNSSNDDGCGPSLNHPTRSNSGNCGTSFHRPAKKKLAPSIDNAAPEFAPNPFNQRLTGNEPIDSNSTQEINAMYAVDGHFWMSEIAVPAPNDEMGTSGETFSVAYATDLDPAFTIHCTYYSNCPEEGQVVHIPGGFMPADGYNKNGEAHAIVVNWTESREDGFYHLNQVVPMVGGKLNIGYGGFCKFGAYQNGKSCSVSSTAGNIPVGNMLLRAHELVAATANGGDLGHVLYITTCVNLSKPRLPATSGNGNGNSECPPMGSRIVLRKTDQQIAALNVPEWDRVILRTLAHYGMMSDDNNNRTVWTFGAEDDNGRTSLGQPAVWPNAIALISQDAAKYGIDMSISSGSYHIVLPYDTLKQSDMAVLSQEPLN